MTSPRGISRAEQKRRKGHAIVANDPQAPTFQRARRAKPFAVLAEVTSKPRPRDLTAIRLFLR